MSLSTDRYFFFFHKLSNLVSFSWCCTVFEIHVFPIKKNITNIIIIIIICCQRSSLLEALQEVKADPRDLAKLTQLQATQTLGRKKFMTPEYTLLNNNTDVERKEDGNQIVSGVKGHKRKRPVNDQEDKPKKIKDPSIVQLGVSSAFTNT